MIARIHAPLLPGLLPALALAALLGTVPAAPAQAQAPAPALASAQTPAASAQDAPFTTEDFFRLRTPSLEALSPDGGRALLSHTSQEGRLGIDNYRFGDPAYVAPVMSRLEVVDTRTGEARALFPGERQVEQAAWSPDGRTLALVLRRGGAAEAREGAPFDLAFWDAEAGDLRTARLPGDRVLAPAGGDLELRWLPDGWGGGLPNVLHRMGGGGPGAVPPRGPRPHRGALK